MIDLNVKYLSCSSVLDALIILLIGGEFSHSIISKLDSIICKLVVKMSEVSYS